MTPLVLWQITAGVLLCVAVVLGIGLCVCCFRYSETQKRNKEKFLAVTENISEGLLILDNSGMVRTYNTAAARLLGADLLRDKRDVRQINGDAELTRIVNDALHGQHGELLLQVGEKPCQLIAHPICHRGKVVGAAVSLLDITEKEGREKLRREFTANVSHELKTPLTSISGFAEIIRDGIAKEGDVRHFAENIYNESQRLINLVEDIIQLSRLDENAGPADWEEVDMQQLIRSTLNHLEPLAMKNQVTFDTRTEPISVYGVPYILDEIVFNLCENAVKYNRPGGRVTVIMTRDNGKPVFCVKDTGIGIPAAEQERVFERFYRVDKSHSRAIGGTGLGLSIVKHGVLFHNAAISLKSGPGVGTTITVTFPN